MVDPFSTSSLVTSASRSEIRTRGQRGVVGSLRRSSDAIGDDSDPIVVLVSVDGGVVDADVGQPAHQQHSLGSQRPQNEVELRLVKNAE